MNRINKKIVIMAIIMVIICISLPASAQEAIINVAIDGEAVDSPDAKPFINASGRTLIPVRFVTRHRTGDHINKRNLYTEMNEKSLHKTLKKPDNSGFFRNCGGA